MLPDLHIRQRSGQRRTRLIHSRWSRNPWRRHALTHDGLPRLLARAVGVSARTLIILFLVIGDAAPTGAAAAAPTPATASPQAGPSSIAALSIDTGQMDHLGDTSRYRYVILQEYMYAHVAAIKRANPGTKVLAYLEAAVTQRQDCAGGPLAAYAAHDSFGVSFCYAAAMHHEWFLHNFSGRPVTYADYPRSTLMDVGNPDYQHTWAANAISALRSDGFDGVYVDDVNTHPGHGVDGKIAEYTDPAYGRAMSSFVATVGDEIRSNGLLVVANVAADPWTKWQRAYGLSIASHLTAYDREHYSRYGDICGPFSEPFNTTATNGTPPLGYLIAYDRAVQATGARLMGIDYGYSSANTRDSATMTYGRAAFLLAWDGKDGGAYMYRPCGTVDPSNPAWTADLGTPTSAAVLTGAVYHRSYSDGLVFLNPSRDKTVSISVPVGYVDTRGISVSGVTGLAPETALLLRRAH